jgi:hypothetical protein
VSVRSQRISSFPIFRSCADRRTELLDSVGVLETLSISFLRDP